MGSVPWANSLNEGAFFSRGAAGNERFGMRFRDCLDGTSNSVAIGELSLCAVRLLYDARFPWFLLVPRRPGLTELTDLNDEDATMAHRICTASWPEREARRLILWGRFDEFITAVFPAKELRARLRREGRRNAPVTAQSRLLRAVIDDELRARTLRSQLASRSDTADWSTSYEQRWVISHQR